MRRRAAEGGSAQRRGSAAAARADALANARPAWHPGPALLICVAIAAALRFVKPGSFPPGLNQDEAINAWNSWCLLHGGRDMTGASWPLFYSHAIGDQRSTLFFYLLMPFQALFGLSAWSTRLPAAVLGLACVPLAAIVARRLFGDVAAICAAALVAIDPWHVWLSRIGIEGGVTPFLALLPLALLALARLLAPREGETPGVAWALAAGLAAGIGCYGYWSVRLWMPAMLALLALSAGPSAWARLREPAFRNAVLALAAGFALTFGPLAWRHLTDPEIGHRAEMTRLWGPDTPLPQVVEMIAQRWAVHFGAKFLFQHGDTYELLQPVHGGALPGLYAPLLVMGAGLAALAWRRSGARVLLALVAAYPLGDALAAYDGVHLLRSSVGAFALLLLAAYGAARLIEGVASFGATARRVATAALALAAIASSARTYAAAFGEYDARPAIWHGFQTELLEASTWLRTHAGPNDTIVCTVTGFNEPWSLMLVGMELDPSRWRAGPLQRRVINGWDVYTRIGNWWFLYDPAEVEKRALSQDALVRAQRTWLVVRPNEVRERTPLQRITDPNGRESLWICEAGR
jgi:4-amino-4-deoxy-L-arabinose transferase-like glycosyltransferase